MPLVTQRSRALDPGSRRQRRHPPKTQRFVCSGWSGPRLRAMTWRRLHATCSRCRNPAADGRSSPTVTRGRVLDRAKRSTRCTKPARRPSAAWRKGIAFLAVGPGRRRHLARSYTNDLARRRQPAVFTTGFPYKKDEYLSYAATCWATMALLSGLPATDVTPPPAPVAESLPVDPAGVMRTALFGTAERLSSYSATDLQVDVATPNGTTILMAAASDVDKVRLLLARGADATFRSPSPGTTPQPQPRRTAAARRPCGRCSMRAPP